MHWAEPLGAVTLLDGEDDRPIARRPAKIRAPSQLFIHAKEQFPLSYSKQMYDSVKFYKIIVAQKFRTFLLLEGKCSSIPSVKIANNFRVSNQIMIDPLTVSSRRTTRPAAWRRGTVAARLLPPRPCK